ncbi:hypothetical protein A1353_14570 [Methylomonas methanica]|uniref:Sel1 repeat family protein n=1 Tax=Methylomonas methanica TaxID=421 RepID=A0A177MCQ8_METMH|nr:tetratricopeptide repeat protein [Methylomonas methanica]OAI03441.1 hypothetical protein A1353_14570 [Methylomonas methanica]
MIGIGIVVIIIVVMIMLSSNKKPLDPFEEFNQISISSKAKVSPYALEAFNEIKANVAQRKIESYWRVGDFYESGNISFEKDQLFPKNKTKALWWRIKAAEGSPIAQQLLGTIYYFGNDLVKQDINEAIKWYNLSADNGEILPLVELGSMYFYGTNDKKIEKDYKKAFEYLSRVVNHEGVKRYGIDRTVAQVGLYNSALLIGELYAHGNGVEQDLIQAYMWCKIGGGDPDTYSKYPLKNKISEADRVTAEKLVSEWYKNN